MLDMNEEKRIEYIPIEKIIPNIYQPRIKFDNESIDDLSKSIKSHGIIQPLILRKIGEKYSRKTSHYLYSYSATVLRWRFRDGERQIK